METINAALRREVARLGEMEAELRMLARAGSACGQLDPMVSCAIMISMLSSSDGVSEETIDEVCTALVSAAASASAVYVASGRAVHDICSSAIACCLPVGDSSRMRTPSAVRARAHMLRLVSNMACSSEARLWPLAIQDNAVKMAEAISVVMPAGVHNSIEMWNVYDTSVRLKGLYGVDAAARFMAKVVHGELGDAKRVAGTLKLVDDLHGSDTLSEDYRVIFNHALRMRSSIAAVNRRDRSISEFVRVCKHLMATSHGYGTAKSVLSIVRHRRGCVQVCCNGGCANIEGRSAHQVKLRHCPKGRGLVYCSDACHHQAWSLHMCPCRPVDKVATGKGCNSCSISF